MLSFWGVLLLMGLLAAVSLLWPLWRQSQILRSQQSESQRDEVVLDLYNEHLSELEKQRAEGALDEAQFQQLKAELDLTLLDDASGDAQKAVVKSSPLLLVIGALVVVVASFWLYDKRGAQPDIEIVALQQQQLMQQMLAARNGTEVDPATSMLLFEKLKERLATHPNNLQNRYMLARLAAEKGDYPLAVDSYKQILAVEDSSAKISAELAQVLFLGANNQVTPEVSMLVARALEIDEADSTALGLAGIEAYQQQRYADAAVYWRRALTSMPPNSAAAQSLMAGITQVERLLGGNTDAVDSVASSDPVPEAAQAAAIRVKVSLAPGVAVNDDQFVFIYARAYQGPPLPLAIQRVTVAALPLELSLDESMAMAPGMNITSFPQLELVARVSQAGTPETSSGDWQATLGPLTLSQIDGPLELVVSEQIP